jgi:hypothetical protein
MDLSVVVAATDAGQSIDVCLRRIAHACAGISAEVLVVDASRDHTTKIVSDNHPTARLFRMPAGTLTPQLWAEGYRQSTGRIVAFTTGHCLVGPAWARSLVGALERGATGAGGPFVIASDTTPLDWAIFYLRYSAFTPKRLGAGRVTGEIAGDNAAYDRRALDRHRTTFNEGFWELDFHRLIRADGGWLEAVPAATVEFGRSFPLTTILSHRFAHGLHFGASRVRAGSRRRWQVLLAAPLVPFVLAARAAMRVIGTPGNPLRFVAASPLFFLLAASWALGEARGAVAGGAS